jgi:hypothetical protein
MTLFLMSLSQAKARATTQAKAHATTQAKAHATTQAKAHATTYGAKTSVSNVAGSGQGL